MKHTCKLGLTTLSLFFAHPVSAEDIPLYLGQEIVVTATRTPYPDVDAPYASEVHTQRMIEQSGAQSLYDYLSKHTSVTVMPSYGNAYTPKLDMRGYGIGDGYQNIVVSLDGRRLNNIDMVPQLIGAIPLADIDRIEITKGSGSVMYGDGATAGSIQIYTRPHSGVSVAASAGNYGAFDGALTAGASSASVDLSAGAEHADRGGYSDPDATGNRDKSSKDSWNAGLRIRPVEGLKLHADAASSRIDTRYVGFMTLAEYNANPALSNGKTYTHQIFESERWSAGLEADIAPRLKLLADHAREDKLSNYVAYNSKYNYDYSADNFAIQYLGENLGLTAGLQTFDGARTSVSDRTSKDNQGYYLQAQYRLDKLTLSAGARREKVKYAYVPNTGVALSDEHSLDAWDLGLNRRINDSLTLFASYNQAFQAPDVDRFFTSFDASGSYIGPQFNGFIVPARSRTLNLGMNHVTASNRLKLALFHASLDNEIYFYSTGPWSGLNTNIDKSHKYGFDLQDAWHMTRDVQASVNYAYTRAIIDQENQAGGTYNGKELPGVPHHSLLLSLDYALAENAGLSLSHTWRSSTWAANDFGNSFVQRQAAYQSTDVAYRYRYKRSEWFVAVDNLFERKNGMWISDDVIYPVNFTRNWRVGFKAGF